MQFTKSAKDSFAFFPSFSFTYFRVHWQGKGGLIFP
ncbi:hypothetical protein VIBRN418_11863 [Vibrio sp. N418]|nr:hypothetical protein VIBRN418_11863 [Vibrio sp. N418]